MAYQLDLFEPMPSEMDLLKHEMKELEESQDRLRKGLFQRHTDMMKMMMKMEKEMDAIRAQLMIVAKNK